MKVKVYYATSVKEIKKILQDDLDLHLCSPADRKEFKCLDKNAPERCKMFKKCHPYLVEVKVVKIK